MEKQRRWGEEGMHSEDKQQGGLEKIKVGWGAGLSHQSPWGAVKVHCIPSFFCSGTMRRKQLKQPSWFDLSWQLEGCYTVTADKLNQLWGCVGQWGVGKASLTLYLEWNFYKKKWGLTVLSQAVSKNPLPLQAFSQLSPIRYVHFPLESI